MNTTTIITPETASKALFAIATRDSAKLHELGITVYGNKGRSWDDTACITNLDHLKGQCNPRLASNWCGLEHIGCPKCLATLQALSEGYGESKKPSAVRVGGGGGGYFKHQQALPAGVPYGY